jgi:5-(aminomethyl)-3-furanmethanol phosphate kinase
VERHGVIVVKVGGSLFKEPNLGSVLPRWLATLREPTVIVPGGGAFADAVRDLDAIHGMNESDAHWLAIRSLGLSRHFLLQLLRNKLDVLDCYDFFIRHDLTPHNWAVTSDSLALAYAQHQRASKLILLKSVTMLEKMTWEEAAKVEIVDEFFPLLMKRQDMDVEVVNLREQCCHPLTRPYGHPLPGDRGEGKKSPPAFSE